MVLLLTISGGLHADGLMDTCDAVFGHASPERRLEIMRDPRAGAFGVAGLVSVIALKIAALASLPAPARLGLVVLAPCLGRWSIVLVTVVFPYGRATGLGSPLKAVASPTTSGAGKRRAHRGLRGRWAVGHRSRRARGGDRTGAGSLADDAAAWSDRRLLRRDV